MKYYPLLFEPILQERIWGGEKLNKILNKPITSDKTGESWEISGVPNNVSVVINGIYKNKSLQELIELYAEELLGSKVFKDFGLQFPLLFKFLDAREDLSIQLHPNDELAQKRHNTFGKTEMWYVVQADAGSRMIVGFKKESSQQEYLESLENHDLLSILDTIEVKDGDVFFLETGTIHAIGAGIVVAEIQQTSDITYRIYDFDRVDAQGKKRELHQELALDAINYKKVFAKRDYKKEENKASNLVDCIFFTTNFIQLTDTIKVEQNRESFKVLMVVDGDFELIIEGEHYFFSKGNTILLPAFCPSFELKGQAKVLEIYIK